jgi:hypothetical protein
VVVLCRGTVLGGGLAVVVVRVSCTGCRVQYLGVRGPGVHDVNDRLDCDRCLVST